MLVSRPRRGVVNQKPQFASVTKPASVASRSTIHWPASNCSVTSTIASDGAPPKLRTRAKWQPFAGSL
jgi:hypothetical protein